MRSTGIATVTLNPAIDQTLFIPNFAAGEVNRVEQEQSDPGGKGVNVASFLADFGYNVTVTGFLGSDNIEPFQKLFIQKGIEDQFIRIPGRTRVNVKIVDNVQTQVTDVNFPGQIATSEHVASLMHTLKGLASDCDWFVLSGSIPTSMPTSLYRDLVAQLKVRGRVVLDTSGEALRLAIAAVPDIIKPNLDELQAILGSRPQTHAEIVRSARMLTEQGMQCVAVSMGAEGAIFVTPDEAVLAVPPTISVKTTVGAGDAMVAGIITAHLRGLALQDCARLATAFSMGALSQIGPRLPPPATVESFMAQVDIQQLT